MAQEACSAVSYLLKVKPTGLGDDLTMDSRQGLRRDAPKLLGQSS